MHPPMDSITPIDVRSNQVLMPEKPTTRKTDWLFASTQLRRAAKNAMSARYCFCKRMVDLFVSGLLLILLMPLGLLLAALVWFTSPGPVFYREERIGRFGVPFRIFKFRSMYVYKADSICNIQTGGHDHLLQMRTFLKHVGNPRVTPVGRFLRKWSLDELPQLLNVFRGEMSLVGPRPIVDAERPIYGTHMQYYTLIHPGMTGLWQVSGRSNVDFSRRVHLDSIYCIHWSLRKDFLLLFKTIPAVLRKTGAY